jgi:hypothetical protein
MVSYFIERIYTPKDFSSGRDDAVIRETRHGLEGPGIIPARPEQPQGPPNPLCSGERVFSGDKAAGAWC